MRAAGPQYGSVSRSLASSLVRSIGASTRESRWSRNSCAHKSHKAASHGRPGDMETHTTLKDELKQQPKQTEWEWTQWGCSLVEYPDADSFVCSMATQTTTAVFRCVSSCLPIPNPASETDGLAYDAEAIGVKGGRADACKEALEEERKALVEA